MTDGRKRVQRALATLIIFPVAGSVVGSLGAAPASAKPEHDLESVQARVDRLYRSAEQASERFNDSRIQLAKAHRSLGHLETDLRRRQAVVDRARERVASSVVAQSQGQALTSTSQVLLSDDPDDFLDRLSTISQFDDQQSRVMASYAAQVGTLQERRTTAAREMSQMAETKIELGADKKRIDDKAASAKKLLGRLKDRAADRAASRSEDRTAGSAAAGTGAAPASGRAAAAVRYAMSKVGGAYVYGAAGPSAFDCSGLTMMAWQQAGVSLPHSSSAQMGSGRPVSQSELRPGDLVFYYSPVSHVGMYIGHGQIVNAENPGAGIKVTGVNSMPYAGAVRPG